MNSIAKRIAEKVNNNNNNLPHMKLDRFAIDDRREKMRTEKGGKSVDASFAAISHAVFPPS